jgi:hypothetical protein
MKRAIAVFIMFLSLPLWAADDKRISYPSYDYEAAISHEIKPHRHSVPLKGVSSGFNQIRITLTVSPTGDVVDAEPGNDPDLLKFWPQLQDEVRKWKFTPFEENGKAVTASVEEYLDLVPPERFPTKHVAAPIIRPDSRVAITLERWGCYGRCPAYKVTVSTEGIVFQGYRFVAALGRQTDRVDAKQVRNLARSFVAADFYSMDDAYRATMTDNPTYVLSISIDGHSKKVLDYVGPTEGMPAVITELEDKVDALARTGRWIRGEEKK